MKNRIAHLTCVLSLLLVAGSGYGILVHSPEELVASLEKAGVRTVIHLAEGEWKDLDVTIKGSGKSTAPLMIKAAVPGKTILTGKTSLILDGEFIVVEGLHFRNAVPAEGAEALISFRGKDKRESSNCRITQVYFENCNPEDPAENYPWIRMYGHNNRIDHCRFSGQDHKGRAIQVRVYAPDPSHCIDHNLFDNRQPGLESNGYEVIQIGLSKDSMKDGNVLVENNVFWRCDGEIEIISSKSNGNIIRNNAFLGCVGTVTLRHGNDSVVADNFFHGANRKGSSGVRIIGTGHRVEGNVFYELDGRTGAVAVLYCGIADSPLNGYFAAHKTLLKDNLFVENHGTAILLTGGYGQRNRSILPTGVRLEGNVIGRSQRGGSVAIAGHLEDLILEGNRFESGQEAGIAASTGIVAATLEFKLGRDCPLPYAVVDGMADRKPLLPEPGTPRIGEVGPDWLK